MSVGNIPAHQTDIYDGEKKVNGNNIQVKG